MRASIPPQKFYIFYQKTTTHRVTTMPTQEHYHSIETISIYGVVRKISSICLRENRTHIFRTSAGYSPIKVGRRELNTFQQDHNLLCYRYTTTY